MVILAPHSHRLAAALTPLLLALVVTRSQSLRAANTTEDLEFFEKRIRPVLVDQCYSCHSGKAEKLKAALRVDGRDHLLRGGESGPALVPGDPSKSLLLRAVTYEDPDLQMPPKTRLPSSAVADLRTWIERGAPWPAGEASAVAASTGSFNLVQRRASHWAWKPVARPPLPSVQRASWATTDLDRFILARLEQEGIPPAAKADRATRIRRASFALVGLPPDPAAVAAFERDPAPDQEAFTRVVDALLASPQFGERWGRHWLDKVRYAETMGHEFDYPILGAWRYRDYVIRAFNQDLPFDIFAREQIAGDLLPEQRTHPADGTRESVLATAQFWFCQQVHSPVDVRAQQAETVDNQIDVVSKAFLGLTVSCARCHDHKFDAISTKDYYALLGILGSSRHLYQAVDDPHPRLAAARELRNLRTELPSAIAPSLLSFLSRNPNVELRPQTNLGSPVLRSEDVRLPDDGWFADGEAFLPDASTPGQPLVLDDTTVRILQPGWRHSAALARRFQGSLRTPTFTLDRDFLHLRLAGSGTRFGLSVEGYTLLRSPIYGSLRRSVQNPEAHWVTLDVSMWKGRRAWIDFSDLSEADPATELSPDSRTAEGWIATADVVRSNLREPPPLLPLVPVADAPAVVRRWADAPHQLNVSEAAWLDALLVAARTNLPAGNLAAIRRTDAAIRPPVLVSTMSEGTGIDESVFIRGNHRTPGPIVPRRFLEALPEIPSKRAEAFAEGTGRLGLAYAITAPENPLFSRVFVNWAWSHLFGRGLVGSVDNFGALGEAPTHPELLDWLADEFQRQGRSPKRLLRLLVLSETWQMSSREASPDAVTKDPNNLLLHRANLRRLEAETLRDAVLAVSGRLDPTVGGPPVPIHLTEFMEGRGRPGSSGPLDGNGRRSIYIEVRRNFLSPFMLAFDQPVPATAVGRRTVSNVPAQALALMNDPFIIGEARRWAGRVLREATAPTGDRVRRLYAQAFSRPPSADELQAATDFIESQLNRQNADVNAAWGDLCHALLNAKEFCFVE